MRRSRNRLSGNNPTLCFCFRREGWQMPNTEQLLYQTDKTSHWRCSIKKAVIKIFTTFTRKSLCWSFFFIKLQNFNLWKETPTQLFSSCKIFAKHLFSRTSAYSCYQTDFTKWLLGTLFLDNHSQARALNTVWLVCRLHI